MKHRVRHGTMPAPDSNAANKKDWLERGMRQLYCASHSHAVNGARVTAVGP